MPGGLITMAPKIWRIKNPVVQSNNHPTTEPDNEKQPRINNTDVTTSNNTSTNTKPQKTKKQTETNSTTFFRHINPKPTTPATKWKIKSTVAAAYDDSQVNEKVNDESVGIDLGVLLDGVKLGVKKKLIVIPLRGILVHRAHLSRPLVLPKNRRPDFCYGNFLVYKRPYCVDFLKFCFERFHVGLWSSAREQNLQGILTNVMGDLKHKLLFTWDQEHCTDSGFMCLDNQDKPLFVKELDHLWQKKYPNLPWSDGEYSASNTLLITSPEKALLNPPNTAICPLNYDPHKEKDDFLGPKGELRVFLEGLAEAEDVQTYVQDHPIGEPEILPSHPDWEYYCKIICSFNKKKTVEPKLI